MDCKLIRAYHFIIANREYKDYFMKVASTDDVFDDAADVIISNNDFRTLFIDAKDELLPSMFIKNGIVYLYKIKTIHATRAHIRITRFNKICSFKCVIKVLSRLIVSTGVIDHHSAGNIIPDKSDGEFKMTVMRRGLLVHNARYQFYQDRIARPMILLIHDTPASSITVEEHIYVALL